MEFLKGYATFIGAGLYMTLWLTIMGVLIGLVLGIAFSVLRYKAGLRFLVDTLISFIRGTPLILQLNFFYFALPSLLHIPVDVITAGIYTLGLNSAAYVAEILRGGIESIPKGQYEAAKTLRIPKWLMWKDIILPQVFRNEFPALTNELITLLKETSLISTLGGVDLMRRAQILSAEKFDYFGPLCIAGCYYYALIVLISYCGRAIEKRWCYAFNH